MELKDILEAILFSSQKPLSAKELQDILKQAGEAGEGESKEFAKTKAAALRALQQHQSDQCQSQKQMNGQNDVFHVKPNFIQSPAR